MKFSDERSQMNELAIKKRGTSTPPVMSTITVQMAPLTITSGIQVQTFVSADSKSAVSTTVVLGTHKEHSRIPSRSRSKTPPLPTAIKSWSRYRSRSQTISQRQASGSIPSSYRQITPVGFRRTLRVSGLNLAEDMKHLTLNESEDIMDFSWE